MKKLLDEGDVADILKISPKLVLKLTRKGKIKSISFGEKIFRYSEESITNYINNNLGIKDNVRRYDIHPDRFGVCSQCGREDVYLVQPKGEGGNKPICKTCFHNNYVYMPSKTDLILEQLKKECPDNNIPMGMLKIIGDRIGVSRERVRQLGKKFGYEMPRQVSNKEHTLICVTCGKEFIGRTSRRCCSKKCYLKYKEKYWTTIQCKNCEKPVKFLKSKIELGRAPVFCSKKCQGKYAGSKYGFQTHPENAIWRNSSKQ